MRFLFALRWKIGDLLKLDEPGAGTGARVPSLRDRVPADLRDGPAGPDSGPFKTLYLSGDEWAGEIANQTMHGVLHLGWVPDGEGGYRGQMAVLVKPNGLLGTAYMAAIAPFRHLVVYPQLLRDIGRQVARRGRGVSLPPGQRALDGFPRFGTHLAYPPPRVLPDHEIAVGGAVVEPFSLPLAALADLPRARR